jgi:hypothetical protein
VRKKTDIRLDLAMNYHTKYEMTVEARTLKPKQNKGYSRFRAVLKKVTNVFLALLIVTMTTFGFGLPAAHALDGGFPTGTDIAMAWCKGTSFIGGAPTPTPDFLTPPKPEGKMTGAEKFGFFPQTTSYPAPYGKDESPDVLDKKGWSDSENAAYSKSGPSGCLRFDIWANAVMTITGQTYNGIVTSIASEEVAMAFGEDVTIVKALKDRIGTVISGKQPGSDVASGEGLVSTLYLDWLIPMIMFAALYMGWVGLVKRRSTEAFNAAIWMIAAATFGLLMLTKPFVLTDEMDKGITGITGGVMTSVAKSTFGTLGEKTNLCEVPSDVGTDKERVVRETQCMIWYQFIYVPLVQSQFGTSGAELQRTNLMPNGVDLGGTEASPRSWATYQLDQQVIDANADQAEIDAKNEAKWLLPITFVGEPSAGVEGSGAINKSWTGENPQRVLPIVFAGIAATGFFIVITILSIGVLIFKIMTIILIAFAPIVLLIGVHPGFGRTIALGWLESLISYGLKQMVYGVMVSMAVLFFGIILTSGLGPFELAIGTIAVTIALIKYRGVIADKMSAVNFGGGGPTDLHKGAESAVDNTAARLGSASLGAGAGAVAAALPRTGGFTGMLAKKAISAATSVATSRAAAPKSLTENEGNFAAPSSAPKTSTNSGSGTKAPHRVGLPVVGESDSKVAGLIGGKSATNGGKNGMGAKASTSSMAKISIPKIEKPNKAGGKHIATSAKAPMKAPSFTRALPDAPKTSSTASVVAKGAFNGAVSGFKNGGSVVGGLGAGFTAGKEVTTSAATADAAKIRKADREVKAAEKSEEARYQERRKAAEVERVSKEKERAAQEKPSKQEKVGALPVTKSTAKGLPRSTSKPLGLPARSTSQSSGGTSRAGAR